MNVLEYSTVMSLDKHIVIQQLAFCFAVPSSNLEAETDQLMTFFVVCRSSSR